MVRLALALLVAAVLPSAAGAFPGERPADEQVAQEVRLALDYWTARGVTGCADGIDARVADDLADVDGVDAMGRGGACVIWLSWPALAPYRERHAPPFLRRYGLEIECMAVVHEVGHALGQEHTDRGIMAAELPRPIPAECFRRAWELVPAPRRIRRAHRHPNVRVAFGAMRSNPGRKGTLTGHR